MSVRIIYEVGEKLHPNSKLKFIRHEKSKIQPNGKKKAIGLFVCECGELSISHIYSVTSGKTKSCGCHQVKMAIESNTKHGLAQHPLHSVWCNMRQRCSDKNSPNYLDYGARGIHVCPEWRENFKSFYDWAISKGWNADLQIDRINNDGNYEPKNCRIVSRSKNCRNRTTSRWWFIDGVKYGSARLASEGTGLSEKQVYTRCRGRRKNGVVVTPPHENCWSEPKYAEAA